MKIINSFIISVVFSTASLGQIQSPDQFLGYELGTRFTPHHRVIDYYQHITSELSNVKRVSYGETYEHRPLIVNFISSQANIDNLEQIRMDNLRRAKSESGSPSTSIPIVWLSYNVHGNESVSTEASMATIYELLKPDSDKAAWLDKVVVAIDPCINPDGRERYVNFYNQYGNKDYNPDPNSKEHVEPWPRGRANHYLFDLNRDWAWQSQIESQGRIKLYNQWLPQVHVDFHEQGVNSPYYFAPAAKPYHELITNWQREFQQTIGKNHAKYFDENSWLYFTKEVFDLLYPSYGDTYPTYNGAIGMTYEQGGSGRAGLGVITEIGDTLTLKDRIAHHYTTGLSTIEVAVNNSDRLLSEYSGYFDRSINNPTGAYKAFIIKGSNHHQKLKDLKSWLDTHGIKYGSTASKTLKGFEYRTGANTSFTVSSNDLVISAYQPKSVLAQILFEPKTKLQDSLTYDITAWSMPYAYDLEAYATTSKVDVEEIQEGSGYVPPSIDGKPYAYISGWDNLLDVRFLTRILRAGIKVRFSEKAFSLDGRQYNPGTLVITRRGNENLGDQFDNEIRQAAVELEKSITTASTGFVDSGVDLGSNQVQYLRAPKVALLQGDAVSSLAFGETWHYFERQIDYPVTVLGTDYFENVDLSEYDVLIVQNGRYNNVGETDLEKIKGWIQAGGRLVLVQGGVDLVADKEGFGLKTKTPEVDNEEIKFGDRRREAMSGFVPGAIFKSTIDNTHPLGFGYPSHYYTLKTREKTYGLLEEGWNVSAIKNGEPVSGFAGSDVIDKTHGSLLFGTESMGRGEIVYLVDNPLFRAFWYNGKMVFSNAIFMVGQF
ncbi:MAG: M14 family metallopeptidase [Cyclobacteriaceae bacterium]